MEASEAAWNAGFDAALEAGASEPLGKVAVAVHYDGQCCAPRSEEEHMRRNVCYLCREPSSATNHVCPACHASVCFPCAKQHLTGCPQCPHCGDVERNATELQEFLAYGQAWSNLAALPENIGVLSKRTVSLVGKLTFEGPTTSRALPTLNIGDPGSPNSSSLKRRLAGQAQLKINHACHFCSCASSALDLSCCRCNISVCTGCARVHLIENTCCPNCNDSEFCNAQTLRLLVHAANLQDSAQNLWTSLVGAGMELFTSSASSPKPRACAERRSAGPSHNVRGGSGQPKQVELPVEAPVTSVIAL